MSETNFVHSVKVPHLYKVSSKIVRTILQEGGSLKELLYTNVRANLKGAYALITKTIERNTDLESIIKKSKVLSENQKLDPWLAKVLIAELLFGKGALQGECKPVQTILSYSKALQNALENSRANSKEKYPAHLDKKPRYVRVNTLRMTCDEAIKALRSEGWQLVPPQESYEEFLKSVRYLTESEFIRDFHLKNVLVFPPRTEFFRHEMYQDGTIILQDKASCLPPHLLNPDPKSTVLDMCAAPGMKTTMLAAMMRGKGKVYAMEINNRRFNTLENMVRAAGCEGVTVIEGDSLQLSPDNAPWCGDVEYVLVDPTCSGTGMTERARLFTYDKNNDAQLRKLTAFQKRLLIHSLTKFPSARRVVYSTCSVQEEENEAVVAAVLGAFKKPAPWVVVPALPEWSSRGSESYEFGRHCVTASPTRDLTTGFFIAVLERVEGVALPKEIESYAKSYVPVKLTKKDKKMKKKEMKNRKKLKIKSEKDLKQNILDVSDENIGELDTAVTDEADVPAENIERVKRKKKMKSEHDATGEVITDAFDVSKAGAIKEERMKKKKLKLSDGLTGIEAENVSAVESVSEKKSKKRETKNSDFVPQEVAEVSGTEGYSGKKVKKRRKEKIDTSREVAFDLTMESESVKKRKKTKEAVCL